MIGIIGAMEEEVAAIKEYMHITDTKNILDCIFYQGMIENKEVVLLQGGVGKVNAAICTTLLLTNYQIDMVINIGSAGGLCLKQEVGDIVISNEVCQYDFDITAFPNRILGEVPGLPPRIKANEDLINKAKIFLEKL
ncbi:5'-methylthioadenosine/S-adenosylhomocysteine nucleosidase, partial [Thomasclavelia cocleata]